jgi:hypothetical protein
MKVYRAAVVFIGLVIAPPAFGQPRQELRAGTSAPSVGRWIRQLASELDHLQEDLFFERGSYPAGLSEQVEQLSLMVAHFQRVQQQSNDQGHLRRDFQEMDRRVHDLVRTLDGSNDPWLRRQASRIRYADEQLHYALERRLDRPRRDAREVLARQAHLLDGLARDLEQLHDRVDRRSTRLDEAIHEFADHADHFHEVVEEGAGRDHLRRDFEQLDAAWHRVVEGLNRSSYGYYLRSVARDIDRVHNQINELVGGGPASVAERPAAPNQPPQRRPAIEFEIPGVGRFQIPQ